ncbi:unnamed protein product, partial [Mesorhabditis belari]|uniref:Protein HTATIP2 n=1 Tax=Mesorhabditis belari TaxID=2138241 RepID=A0AAF3FGY1_9BILA
MSSESLSAFIVGASGAVGKRLVQVLSKDNNFSRIVLLGRRTLELEEPSQKVEQRVIDFEKLDEHRAAFDGFDVGFCALGTTRAKSGAKGFYRVDHDYIVESAKLAKAGGTKTFCLVSSGGANENSPFLYMKTKGQVEREITEMGFDRLVIAQPGVLEGPREEFRFAEAAAKFFLKPMKLFTNNLAIETIDVAKALTLCSLQKGASNRVEIIQNADLIKMARSYDEKK